MVVFKAEDSDHISPIGILAGNPTKTISIGTEVFADVPPIRFDGVSSSLFLTRGVPDIHYPPIIKNMGPRGPKTVTFQAINGGLLRRNN